MKRDGNKKDGKHYWSLPTQGAWIETDMIGTDFDMTTSLPTQGAWIETLEDRIKLDENGSLPTQGAWIETRHVHPLQGCCKVAPYTGSVD